MKKRLAPVILLMIAFLALAIVPAAAQDEFVFGLVLVGAQDDRGWSQAHYEAGQYVVDHVPGTRMLVFESLNEVDNPGRTVLDVTAEFVAEGAQVIFTTSDTFEEATIPAAEAYPDVTFIAISGDDVLTGNAPPNLGNLMGQIEWAKLMAGCAAAVTTQTGSIGYLGPLINAETRRLAASAYLGARYCYEHYRNQDPAELIFTVIWINFWFNIPGVTLDPTEVTNNFFDDGADVVISGIDTSEAITIAGERAARGEAVWAVPFNYVGACETAPEACLGVPYFRWGPDYARIVQQVMEGTWAQRWEWVAPDWSDINNPDTSPIGFVPGDGLTEEALAGLENFIADVTAYGINPFIPSSVALWRGPLRLQDGTLLTQAGQLADPLDIWYLSQLLEGMIGLSN
ncbi:MAG: BMP family ABC transporter substrate-binding protein [Chloroflexi bacterium]|nr:BMP family ABC transporter substrate-binding protein [Chloroflexota bacterium]